MHNPRRRGGLAPPHVSGATLSSDRILIFSMCERELHAQLCRYSMASHIGEERTSRPAIRAAQCGSQPDRQLQVSNLASCTIFPQQARWSGLH
jgi:hypothetical protein